MNRNYNFLSESTFTVLKSENLEVSNATSKFSKMKWILSSLLLLCMLFTGFTSKAQVTVTGAANTTPAMSSSYGSLALAIADINNRTAISGVVTITLTTAETAPAGGYVLNNVAITGGSDTNRFIIDGGNNSITAPSPAGTAGNLNDGIFKVIGADFITIQNFVMNENVANTTTTAASNNMVEWGVAILYATTTNGAQGIVIKNNTITLNRTYQNTFGIYSNSTHSATAPTTSATATTTAGGNSNLKIYNNTISNVNIGVLVVGPTAIADANTGIEIGGTGLGNSITNFGTTGTFSGYANVSGSVNGILIRNSNGYVISNNTIASSNGGVTSGTLNGIFQQGSTNAPTATFTNNINNNSISLRSGLAGGAINGINVPSGSSSATSSLNINGNDFNTFGHTVAASGAITFIINASVHANTSMSNNTFSNITVNTTGSVTFISNSINAPATGSKIINGNSIVGTFSKTGAGGTVQIYLDGGSSVCTSPVQNNNNNFSNITLTGATTMVGWFNNDGTGATPQKQMTGNTFSNWACGSSSVIVLQTNFGGNLTLSNNTVSNISGASTITGILQGSSGTIATSTIANNTVTGLASTGGAVIGVSGTHGSTTVNHNNNILRNFSSTTSNVTGLSHTGAATNVNIFKNTISDLLGGAASSVVTGLSVTSGTTVTTSNNRIGDLRATAANAANAVLGISLTGGTTHNVYYNTVNLAAASSGALFGSSAISVSTTPTVTFNNNNFVNNSTANGAGLSVAYRRSTATLTTYGSGSNRNNFFASTIYTDGTTPQTTIAAYKALVTSRDANSINVAPVFLSTTSGNANFLKVDTTVATQLESGAANVAGITDDFENDIRQGNPGYGTQVNGGGTSPDIGADEFDGIPAPVCLGTPAASTINGASSLCTNTGTTLSLSSTYTDLGITYQWSSGTTIGGPYPNVLGSGATQATGNLTTTTYYVCTITCTNSGLSFVTAEKAVVVNPLPTISVTPSTASICSPGGSAITLVASGASTYTWSPAAGLSATTGSSVSANPTATTTYTITGTDANGCVNTATATITVVAKPDPVTISPAAPTICSGDIQMLTANGGGSAGTSATIGSGTAFTSSTGEQTAFCNRRINYVGQTIYTAAELLAAGVTPGNITSLAYNISSNGDATTNANYTVKIGHIGSTVNFSSTTFVSNATFTTVYGPATYTHAAPGFQVINFTTPFVWNGVDNICIDVRHDGIDSINNAQTQFTTTAGNASIFGFNTPATGTLSTTRLNIRLGFSNPPTDIVWAPTTDLYTDPSATITYTGSPSTTVVYAKLTSTQSYTATSTNAAGCTSSANVTVTVSSGAAITTEPVASAKCSGETATFTVLATGPSLTYQWRKGGVPLTDGGTISGATTATLTLTGVTATDADLYDVVVSSTCGSPVTSAQASLTVNPLPATVIVLGAGTYCTSTTITASNGGDGVIYFQGTTSGGTSTTTASSSQVVNASGTYYFRALSAAGCWGAEGSVAVVIETPPGITGTDASICQGASGTIAAVAANNCTSLQPTGNTLSGAWTVSSPSADRPNTSTNSATCGFSSGTLRNYEAINFQVSVSGTYTFEMNDNASYDGIAYLVSGAFVPGSCASGTFIKGDDDSGSGNEPVFTANLTTGVTYTLISSNWDTATLIASFAWTITPPASGNILLPTPGAIEWYTSASGGSPIGSGSPFNPVGVAGSGLADTNTPGTTIYYAACSSSSSCRTPVNFVINANVTYYQDADGDGFGNPAVSQTSCTTTPVGYVTNSTDCNDNQIQYADVDGDGFGSTTQVACGVANSSDCNDNQIQYFDGDGDNYGSAVQVACGVVNTGDCNDNNAAVNPGATEVCYDGIDNNCNGTIDEGCTPIVTVVQSAQCGSTLATIDQYIYANLVAGAQGYRFRVTDMTTNQVQTIDKALRVFQLTQLGNYAFNRTYQVEVSVRYANVWQPFYGLPCTVTTPATTTQVQSAQCGSSLTNMNDIIFANNVPFATGYRFRITNLLTSAQQVVDRPVRDVRMSNTSIAEFNSTYSVEVAVRNTDGSYLPYGTGCNITTPSFPTSQLQTTQCDVTITNMNTTIFADSYTGASTYRFRFTSGAFTYVFDRPTRSFVLNTVPGLQPSTVYTVQVALEINGVFGPYGKTCTITTPGSAKAVAASEAKFEVVSYPNPFGDSFQLDVNTTSEDKLELRVYDMIGKLIENKTVEAIDINSIQLGAAYPSGVYNVIVSQGSDVKTLRVIKR